ncbi:MAG: hypothetical protein LLH30_10435 [Candidatus Manganitrophus sp. SA1]|nr:hypothetical protein [Candidatus Manganitrophus morganii]
MRARYLAKYTTGILIGFILLLLGAGVSQAAVLFLSNAESGTCDTAVPTSIWSYTGSGAGITARMSYRCDTPVPNSGRSKYFRIDTVNLQHDSWNVQDVNRFNLTPGVTYYLGGFFRFDRILGLDIWHDGNGVPDSYDKLFEFYNPTARAIIAVGFPDWAQCSNNVCDHHFTFGAYLPFETCSNCIYEQVWPNVAPYSRTNFFLADYGKWYAVVLGFTPSNGSTSNGRLRLWINGILTTDVQNIKTQDSSSPTVTQFMHSGTTAQPAYDAPAHQRKMDHLILSDSLTDIQNAGLMTDPEAGAPRPPANLKVQ